MESLWNMGWCFVTTCTEHPEKPNPKVSPCFNNLDYPLHIYAQIKKKINKHVPMVWPESTSIPDPTFIVKISTSRVHAISARHITPKTMRVNLRGTRNLTCKPLLSLSDCVCASQFKFRLLLSDPFCFLDMPYCLRFFSNPKHCTRIYKTIYIYIYII